MGNWKSHKKKRSNIVVYANNYMEALCQTDYLAKKIMVTASLCAQDEDWTEKGCEITLTSNELRSISGLKKSSLQHLKHAVKKLTETSITVDNPNDPVNHWKVFSFLPNGEYDNGILNLIINNEMKPFIQNLQRNFTEYHIENIKHLKSGYSIRIFELLKMSAYKGKYRVELDALKKMFGIEDKYKFYANFKKDVLEVAKRELKEHCEIYFEYREIKTGNKVTEIEFKIFRQSKEFSLSEAVINATIKDIEFKDIIQKTSTKDGVRTEQNYSELGKKLIKLGFMGDVERYINEEGREVIEEALKGLEGQFNVRSMGGLLRRRVGAIKERQTLLEQEKAENTQKAGKELHDRIDKYLAKTNSFPEDYNRFIEIHLLEEDINILQKYTGSEIEKLPQRILDDFLQWAT